MIRLTTQETADVLADHGVNFPVLLATELARTGYVLVAASGVALHIASERGDLDSLPPAAPEQAERVDAWFAPERTS
jgi:hypothetical protein